MAPLTKDTDAIDKADTRRPLIVLRTRSSPISFFTSHHSVNLQVSLFSPANPTKPFNMTTVEPQGLDSFSDRAQQSRPASAAGSIPSSVQRTMGLTIEGPIDEFVINMKKDFVGRFNDINEQLGENYDGIKALEKSVKALESSVSELKESVDKRVDGLEERFGKMERQLRRIEALLGGRQNPTPGTSASEDSDHGDGGSQHHSEAEDTAPQPQQAVQPAPAPTQPVQPPQPPPIPPTHLAPPTAPVIHTSVSSPSLRSSSSKRSFKRMMKQLLRSKKDLDESFKYLFDEEAVSPHLSNFPRLPPPDCRPFYRCTAAACWSFH
ncbi:hypothetical protein BN946_scf184970.g41 [Trametes cinnabarina]|uniref:Uncharacterized protein n=1 Tax=Pycnoporus cinnabarinus TaxID=5643 RepID=A0A060SIY4_PYCCI|nr:hypothetical protein BN946_scf184970.g41 [Trametes cinnabarina]